jgi:ribosomal protein S17
MMVKILFYMTLGMVVGMVASPVMMKTIKVIKQRRRVSKILQKAGNYMRNNSCFSYT